MSQPDKPILDYDPTRPDRLLMRRSAVHVAVLIDVLLAAIFAVTRQIQLRQPDSYNNVWTEISTFALLTGVALWAVLVVAALNLRRHGKTLNSFAYIWLTIAGIPVAVGIVRMLLFVFGR
jgi:hypothetical protein